ncbi:unnamed protein product (macronuclear) [Paramecium tetraurelia]|uniref:Transmembrane protein n=1 Tax=Paramecium tetraurelia TaxID=5888 RepID=A0C1V7_PARTE|nr:uncharacterized protein GSPATT00034251001 [Paramecium tetraurelia]CAK64774.1 unnamed protein product [Paramecium tetraurelia]|eukprot:XP_001432171.1 hypothetical protein (macronuclear) [Paramecium tetraurelia strain d4-2]
MSVIQHFSLLQPCPQCISSYFFQSTSFKSSKSGVAMLTQLLVVFYVPSYYHQEFSLKAPTCTLYSRGQIQSIAFVNIQSTLEQFYNRYYLFQFQGQTTKYTKIEYSSFVFGIGTVNTDAIGSSEGKILQFLRQNQFLQLCWVHSTINIMLLGLSEWQSSFHFARLRYYLFCLIRFSIKSHPCKLLVLKLCYVINQFLSILNLNTIYCRVCGRLLYASISDLKKFPKNKQTLASYLNLFILPLIFQVSNVLKVMHSTSAALENLELFFVYLILALHISIANLEVMINRHAPKHKYY